jgi:hypothetical protein
LSTEKDHSPDNAIETGETTDMGSIVIVAASDGKDSIVGVAVHAPEVTKKANTRNRAIQRHTI